MFTSDIGTKTPFSYFRLERDPSGVSHPDPERLLGPAHIRRLQDHPHEPGDRATPGALLPPPDVRSGT